MTVDEMIAALHAARTSGLGSKKVLLPGGSSAETEIKYLYGINDVNPVAPIAYVRGILIGVKE